MDERTAHNLVIAAIFKNENRYIQEWLEFHILVGVDHFYLYDNDGGDAAKQILKPYIEQGYVTLHPWTHLDGTKFDRPTPLKQRNKNHIAFGHAAKTYRDRFQWIMKIDIDEFLFPLEGDRIPPLLTRYDRRWVKGIRIPRVNFGDSGHRTRPEGLIGAAYTRREATFSDHKDLGNSRFLSSNDHTNSAHAWGYHWWRPGRVVSESTVDQMRVNHYYTKSLEEWLTRQNTSLGRPSTEEGFVLKNAGRNAVLDESMLPFSRRVQEAIARRSS
jgi:Glycosyltransferase family 92